jgi:signal transduction histidine kinase
MDVLDYAKVREPHRRNLEISPFLNGIVEPLRQHAKDMGVSLVTDGTPCTANLDPNRFARVVENLLANALDATAETRGEVLLGWERVTGGVQVRVKDTGKGIPKKVMRRIFEPFYSFGKRKGTGLGMATVKKIVEEHGGSLEVLSEEGVGTTVIMTIPDHGPTAQSSGSHKITGAFDAIKGSGEHRQPSSGEQYPTPGDA